MIQQKFTQIEWSRLLNFMRQIHRLIPSVNIPFRTSFHKSKNRVPLKESLFLPRKPIEEGVTWGSKWEKGYFKLEATVPKTWGQKPLAAWLDFGCELLVYDKKGNALVGLTNGSIFSENYSKPFYHLGKLKAGERIVLYVEAVAMGLFGITRNPDAEQKDSARHGKYEPRIATCRLVLFHEDLWHYHIDMDILTGIIDDQGFETVRSAKIMRGLMAAMHAFKDDPANAKTCRKMIKPLMEKRASASALTGIAVGHAHIDTGWLWRIEETYGKTARTWASQLGLIKRYPGYVFGASMAEHYQMMKDRYPEIYARVKEEIRTRRWEIQGAMWVEADCNLTSGESLVRQFLMGKNFFMDEFGMDVTNCWIPDVFGYSGAMPQIMKKSGVDFFLTQKLSWSKINPFPHQTFHWVGIDGSSVITHFLPENSYNSTLHTKQCAIGERTFYEKDVLDEYLIAFGIGDGGGGPSEEYIERGMRLYDLEGSPKVRFGRVDEFFRRLSKKAKNLAEWKGELYLEVHRGTLTTQAKMKKCNRKLESALRQAEALLSQFSLKNYPRSEIQAIWKSLLLHQFHDILPGSSIHAVYEDAEKTFARNFGILENLVTSAVNKHMRKRKNVLSVFNALSYPCEVLVGFRTDEKYKSIRTAEGELIPLQREFDHSVARLKLDASGWTVFKVEEGVSPSVVRGKDLVLENELIRYVFDSKGHLVSAYDKEKSKEIIPKGGKANLLSLYVDRPHDFDAWDIDHYYAKDLVADLDGEFLGSFGGPVRSALMFTFNFSESVMSQTVHLESRSKRLDFHTSIRWNERHKLLKVAFPTVLKSDFASFDVQYGTIRRTTHDNTSWDMAQFEVCGHKFADLSESDYGVALLNDCKYGYRAKGSTLELSLLRSPTEPDPDADWGDHEFIYSFYPHANNLNESDVREQAAVLNMPPLVIRDRVPLEKTLPFSVTGNGISIEVIKKAEKEDCLVFRLVETKGETSKATLRTHWGPVRLVETLLTEWNDGPSFILKDMRMIEMRPFEIRTYKVQCL